MNKLLSSKFILPEPCLTVLASHPLWLFHKCQMIRRTGIWDFFSVAVNLGSSPAVESKTNFTCAGSDPSCVWSGTIRLHPLRCWNMGNRTNPRATLIKAELRQAGLINKAPKTPQMGVVQDQNQPALTNGWEALEAPFEAQPELCWHWSKCLQPTLII